MPLDVSVDIELDRPVGQDIRTAQKDRMMDAATAGYNWSLEQAPEDRGTLKQTSIPPEWRGSTLVWGYTQPYARAQEFGSVPYYPPLQPLLEWSQRVSGGKGLGFYVAREKIPEEGIAAKRFTRSGKDRQEQWLSSHSFSEYFESMG